ncbi:dihydropyrimidinase [Anaerotruncus sp. AF02-27]|uniref:dihydropyrimidinase n=1 Tax=Anaerotruncus TaxID=244127 RepID=UPI000E4B7900|nr:MULTISPECIES: dihydropyrimidinase [Anaerotruncus]RGX54762.1 dihydropyrimidinase [Anaerotruncus sp. AF02-27]
MKYELLIKNGHVYAPQDLGVVDIAVTDGKIAKVGKGLDAEAVRVIDAFGKTVIPGAIETHAHMNMPFAGTKTMNDFYDGTMSGAFGGVTTLVDFAQQIKGVPLIMACEDRVKEAKGHAVVDYGFHATITTVDDETIDAIPKLMEMGFTSFKVHTTYKDGGLYIDTPGLRRTFAAIAKAGGIVTVHAENDDMIEAAKNHLLAEGKTGAVYFPQYKPDEAEAEAVDRCIEIAKETGCKLLIRHISSAAGAKSVAAAQKAGYPVYGETCPQYLAFTREVYTQENGRDYILHPPIRGAADRDAIWGELVESDVKCTMATDDCGFYLSQKRMNDTFYGVPGGLPGIETRLVTLYEMGVAQGRIGVGRMVEMLSTEPAKLYGIYPQKGVIAEGSDADIVVLDTGVSYALTAKDLHERSDYTPFEGMQMHAAVAQTVANGKVIVDGREFLGEEGAGRFLVRGKPQG